MPKEYWTTFAPSGCLQFLKTLISWSNIEALLALQASLQKMIFRINHAATKTSERF